MRILIVDDTPEICLTYQKQMRALGHEAVAVQDSSKALDYAKHFHPDVILVDLCMPKIDGWQVGEQLRADPATRITRLVAMTGMTNSTCERRSVEAGFDAHISKPVRLEQWPAILTQGGRSGANASGVRNQAYSLRNSS